MVDAFKIFPDIAFKRIKFRPINRATTLSLSLKCGKPVYRGVSAFTQSARIGIVYKSPLEYRLYYITKRVMRDPVPERRG